MLIRLRSSCSLLGLVTSLALADLGHAQALQEGSVLVACLGYDASTLARLPAGNLLFDVDTFTGTTTPVNTTGYSGATGEIPMAVEVETTTRFLLGTTTLTPASTIQSGNLYRVSWSQGSGWVAVPLLPQQIIGEGVSNIAVIGGEIWFTTTLLWVNTANPGCRVWSVPIGGGAPTLRLDLMAMLVPGSWGAIAAVGTTAHVFTFSPGGPSAHWAIDTAPPIPVATQIGQLPLSQRPGLAGSGLGAVNAEWDPQTNAMVVTGIWGDVLWRDTTGTNVRHRFVPTTYTSQLGDQFAGGLAINSDTGAILWGDKAAHIEEMHTQNGAMLLDRTTIPTAPGTSAMIMGLAYVPLGAGTGYRPTGPAGCPQGNGAWPINYCNRLPTAGSTGFAITLESNAATAFLVLGANNQAWNGIPLPFDLGSLGGASGCLVGTSGDIAAVPMAIVAGVRQVALPPLPPAPFALTAYTQWVVFDPSNPLGIVLSDARELVIR